MLNWSFSHDMYCSVIMGFSWSTCCERQFELMAFALVILLISRLSFILNNKYLKGTKKMKLNLPEKQTLREINEVQFRRVNVARFVACLQKCISLAGICHHIVSNNDLFFFFSKKVLIFLYALLKNGTYYVTGYGIRLSICP